MPFFSDSIRIMALYIRMYQCGHCINALPFMNSSCKFSGLLYVGVQTSRMAEWKERTVLPSNIAKQCEAKCYPYIFPQVGWVSWLRLTDGDNSGLRNGQIDNFLGQVLRSTIVKKKCKICSQNSTMATEPVSCLKMLLQYCSLTVSMLAG